MMFGVRAKANLHLAVLVFVCIMKANSTQMLNPQSSENGIKVENENSIFEYEEYERIFPNWNSYDNVSDLYFPNEDNWIDFKSKINNAIANVIENNPLNNVDQFIRFIQDYKNQNGDKKPLNLFFNQYNVPFRPLENRVSFLLEIYQQLTESYPQAKDLLNMVQAYVDPVDTLVEEVKQSQHLNMFDVRLYSYQVHIAGVIRITIDKNLKEKGIIILDPGYMNGGKRVNPYCVVLMENTKSKYNGVRLYGNEYGGIDFTMGPEFVLASGKLTKQTKRNVLYELQYHPRVSNILCIMSTRRNIMAPFYGIMTFLPNGVPKAYLTFKVVPENISNKSHSFLIGTFTRETETYFPHEVTFESLKANTSIDNKDTNYLNFIQFKKGDNLLTKLQTLQSELFEDRDLVTAIFNLTNKLNPKKPLTQKEEIDVMLEQLRTNKSDSEHSEFGCTFENKKYKLDTDSPIWSSKDTPKELIFKNNDAWLKFQGKIREAFTEVMEKGYALNNIDHFIRFIEAYKNKSRKQKNLESFFDEYHVPGIQPLEDPVSLLVEINQRLKDMYPIAKMYMVSAYINPPENFVADVRKSRDNILDYAEKNAEYELTQSRFQRHIAGIIKIQVNDTKGIVILDPGHYSDSGFSRVFPNLIIILEKNNLSYNGGHLYGQSEIFETVLAHRFALISFKTPTTLLNNTQRILYLHNKAFCSFMDSTIKGNLLAPKHGILTFDKNGSPKGYLATIIVDQHILQHHNVTPFFTIASILKENLKFMPQTWYFDSIEPENMTQRTQNIMKNATEYLDNDFLSKLRTIWSKVIQDPDLLSEIYKLNQKLIDTEKKPQPQPQPSSPRKSKMHDLFHRIICGK